MNSVRKACFAVTAIAGVIFSTIGAAEAKSCSDRFGTCQRFCDKSRPGSVGCQSKCGEYLKQCLTTGCWESKIVAKECGFTQN